MDTKKFLFGTVGGTLGAFISGALIFGLALSDYMASNMHAEVVKDPPDFVIVFIAHIFLGAFLSYIFTKWAGITTAGSGLKAGLILGLLVALFYDLLFLGTSHIFSGGASFVALDVIGTAAIVGIGGAAAGWAIGKAG